MAKYIFGGRCVTPVLPAKHGDSSGVRGAAWAGEQALQG
ncbi:fructokinase domain protein [Klebsiella oxytoca KA-2]|nr:fructokinase domain protein [Klebsiella oxytoca KA-2]